LHVTGFIFVLAVLVFSASARAVSTQTFWKYDFGSVTATGCTAVRPDAAYSAQAGFGFDDGSVVTAVACGGADRLRDGFVTSDKPFTFSVAVPEGNYRVTVVLGDAQESSMTTVRAEARRLMLERVQTAAGKFETRTFTVAVKRPALKAGGEVRLKPDEQSGHRDWDNKLTLEFSDARPCLCALEIVPAHPMTTLYIAGDSTVTNQRSEPYVGWGQMLPRFFTDAVAVANHAHSGESLSSSLTAKRFDKIFESLRPGDYLFIQFGHNDQKDKTAGAGPFTTYKERLRAVVKRARAAKALPVVIASMERRIFEGERIKPSLAEFAEAARQVSREEDVPLIDLHAMSMQLYEALGPKTSTKAFVHFPANTFPGQTAPLKDDTHFTSYGGYELARCVVEGIRSAKLGLINSLSPDVTAFNPSHPDQLENWALPASPFVTPQKPEGN
jgi:lysophospholipase L1-like esterase